MKKQTNNKLTCKEKGKHTNVFMYAYIYTRSRETKSHSPL